MKSMKRSMWAGTVAVALLLGGFGGLATQQAYADDDDDDSSVVSAPAPADTSIPLNKRFKLDWSEVEGNASNALSMDWIDLNDALASGKSIADIALSKGVNVEGLTDQLAQLESSQVADALQSNKITQDEADKLNKQIQSKVQKIVEKEGYQDKAKTPGEKTKKLQLGYKVKAADIAELLGISKNEVKQGLADGKTLADLAAVKGITEDQLVDKLSNQVKPSLEALIHTSEK
ncbi:hypothetical protein ACHHV8_33205 [Paenibacillus sp. TAB 01]|uniref:hypothetical protein n=1 Tax=Paenibacillus sp. TAB 01 TaxID=3368988 RepID=UPI003752B6D4